jgi:hypothetical protein
LFAGTVESIVFLPPMRTPLSSGHDSPARPWKTVVVAGEGPGLRAKHLFAPCLHAHASGQLLVVCRWDAHGADEGDATNEQALFFSRDGGLSWRLAGDGAILTCALGTSFDRPSSITHAWIFEDRAGATWLYYTINQPFTWGEHRPDRSTGGGEIRRQRIEWNGADWQRTGASEIVWAFQRSLPDGRGGTWRDIRVVAWNGLARLDDGSLVMPVGGRSSVREPRGGFDRLDRVWVLVSRDDGATWPEAHFVAGGDTLCVAEPTLVTTSICDELVCLLRVQYRTGNQLHRTGSRDGGRTWSPPVPTGLPQADHQGVKPFLLRRGDGSYALIQTNEHEVIERTNLAVFLTDERGLRTDRWPRVRTLHIGNRRGWWPGACYGWLAEDRHGDLLAAWPSHDAHGGTLLFARLTRADLERPVGVQPNGVADESGDDVPRFEAADGWCFRNVRGRLVAADFGVLDEARTREVRLQLRVRALTERGVFRVLRFTAHNGRDEVGVLLLSGDGWRWRAAGRKDSWRLRDEEEWIDVRCRMDGVAAVLEVGGCAATVALSAVPTGLQVGGALDRDACEIHVRKVAYRELDGRGEAVQ